MEYTLLAKLSVMLATFEDLRTDVREYNSYSPYVERLESIQKEIAELTMLINQDILA